MLAFGLRNIPWETPLYHKHSCRDQFVYFTDTLNELIETHLPWMQVKRNTNDKVWITYHFRDLCAKKHQAKKRDTDQYKYLTNHMSRSLKANYYKRKVKDANQRQFWKIVDSLTEPNRKSTDSLQHLANTLCNGDLEVHADKANIFQFISKDLLV